MSEAPHVEPNMSDYPDFDPSAPSNANSYTNGDTNIQNTKNTVLSSEVSDITTRPKLAETQLTLVHQAYLHFSHHPFSFSDDHVAAQSAMETVQNHPVTQNIKETVNNGEVSISRIPVQP